MALRKDARSRRGWYGTRRRRRIEEDCPRATLSAKVSPKPCI